MHTKYLDRTKLKIRKNIWTCEF